MDIKRNVVGWIEIPAKDMDRAMAFYNTVFDFTLERHQLGDQDMAWFPWIADGQGSGAALVHQPDSDPRANSIMLYFTAHSGDVNNELARVEAAGGKAITEKTAIPENHGFFAIIEDTEGNRIALHSME